MDEQKCRKPLKAKDVLFGSRSRDLVRHSVELFASSRVLFWSTTTPYLQNELKVRGGEPIAIDRNTGESIVGEEFPVFMMMAGSAAEEPDVQERGTLEVLVDQSKQNGLHADPNVMS